MADLEQLLQRLDDIESLLVKSKAAPEARADPAALVEELREAVDAGREVWSVRLDELWLAVAELNERLGGAPADGGRPGATNERELVKRLEVLSDAVTELTRVMPRTTGRTAGIPGHLAELLGRIDQRLLAVERMGREQFELDQRLSGLEQMLEALTPASLSTPSEGHTEPAAAPHGRRPEPADRRDGEELAERLTTRIAELEAFLTYTVEQRVTALRTSLDAALAPLHGLPEEVRRLGEQVGGATTAGLLTGAEGRLAPHLDRVAAQLQTLRVALVDGQGAAEVGRLTAAVLGLTREVELVRRRLEHAEAPQAATDGERPPLP